MAALGAQQPPEAQAAVLNIAEWPLDVRGSRLFPSAAAVRAGAGGNSGQKGPLTVSRRLSAPGPSGPLSTPTDSAQRHALEAGRTSLKLQSPPGQARPPSRYSHSAAGASEDLSGAHRATMVRAKTLQVVWHSKEPVYSGAWLHRGSGAPCGARCGDRCPCWSATAARRARPTLTPDAHAWAAPNSAAAVDFHPNGQLVTGGADKEVKVWEVRQWLCRPRGPTCCSGQMQHHGCLPALSTTRPPGPTPAPRWPAAATAMPACGTCLA